MFLSLVRVTKLAFQQFHRNLWLSVVTISLLILPLLVINLVIGLGVVAQVTRDAVQDKIDVSVYFKPAVANEEVESLRVAVLALPEVKSVDYIPREGSLARFRERHKNDPVILESLDELGENPFGATLAVKAKNPEDYPRILAFLENEQYKDKIEEKNFEDHRLIISRINNLVRSISIFGLTVAGVFGLIAVLIVINTVRVAIYTHRGEIGVMRMVGAGNWFIRGPFLIESVVFSVVAVAAAAAIVYPALNFAQPYLNNLFNGANISLISYYNRYFVMIFGGQLLGVFVLTALASFFGVRRYLKV
ncbi:MAG: cell division protein FtsX [Parcubacteria group bacterium GW2011_GWA2_47_26]|nr:MAG: cell division protein FtsX [Parcubacteria group bacterium GW2011_GWA2_47_26]HLD34299.1 permease-like cell division protein FtsX [Patescibacteria group bacterium]